MQYKEINKQKKSSLAVSLMTLIIFSYGCDQNNGSTNEKSSKISTTPEGAEDSTKIPLARFRTGSIVQDLSPDEQGAKVYSAAQVSSAIEQCFGPGKTIIRAESIIAVGKSTKKADAFLLPRIYTPGDDIIEKNKVLFDGSDTLTATKSRSSLLTLEYLTALQLTANVVAHNCYLDPSKDSLVENLCVCSTEEKAENMLERCLGQYSPNKFETMIKSFSETCAINQKEAIASLVSSLGFVWMP